MWISGSLKRRVWLSGCGQSTPKATTCRAPAHVECSSPSSISAGMCFPGWISLKSNKNRLLSGMSRPEASCSTSSFLKLRLRKASHCKSSSTNPSNHALDGAGTHSSRISLNIAPSNKYNIYETLDHRDSHSSLVGTQLLRPAAEPASSNVGLLGSPNSCRAHSGARLQWGIPTEAGSQSVQASTSSKICSSYFVPNWLPVALAGISGSGGEAGSSRGWRPSPVPSST